MFSVMMERNCGDGHAGTAMELRAMLRGVLDGVYSRVGLAYVCASSAGTYAVAWPYRSHAQQIYRRKRRGPKERETDATLVADFIVLVVPKQA